MQPEWSILTKRYRRQFGLTQHGMGQLLGVSQKTVSRWESGENQPSLAQQQQFRELLRKPGNAVSAVLRAAVAHCPAKRMLALHKNCTLLAASKPSSPWSPPSWIGSGAVFRPLLPASCAKYSTTGNCSAVSRPARSRAFPSSAEMFLQLASTRRRLRYGVRPRIFSSTAHCSATRFPCAEATAMFPVTGL